MDEVTADIPDGMSAVFFRVASDTLFKSILIIRRNIYMVKVNGESYDFAGLTVLEMLEKLDFFAERIAVEINLEIVPKASYSATTLKDEDTVEVVSFVGGG